MKSSRLILILLFALLFAFSCSGGDDDDDNDDNDVADDDISDDDAADDDDNNDVADDDVTDDDDDDAPHPYTPCCDVNAETINMSDPGLPADGNGPYQIFSIERTFIDAERDREIEANIIYPSTDGSSPATDAAPFPLVVVSHGFSGTRATVRQYGERLATWGYIAIVPQLPYTNPFAILKLSHLESAKDILFLLNTACCEHEQDGSDFFDLVDRARLATVGHSLGGKLSTLAAVFDGGPRAVVGLDPVDGSGPIDFGDDNPDFPDVAPDNAPNLLVPTLYLGGSESGIEVFGQACAPTEENYHEFWTYSPPPSQEITFLGADHTDFIIQLPGDICDVGTADHVIVKQLAKEYMIAFLNVQLRGWDRFEDDYAGAGIETDVQAGHVTWQAK